MPAAWVVIEEKWTHQDMTYKPLASFKNGDLGKRQAMAFATGLAEKVDNKAEVKLNTEDKTIRIWNEADTYKPAHSVWVVAYVPSVTRGVPRF